MMNNDFTLLTGGFDPEDRDDNILRPKRLDEFIGQKKSVENLRVFIQAATKRGEPLDHLLLYGPPGLGKTTLANIISEELGVNIKSTSGPIIEKSGELAALLTSMEERDVLFIDEIHRLQNNIEEFIYPAMEDFKIDIIIGQGSTARSLKLNLKPFTLIGATTRSGLLTAPLRARFGIDIRFDYYKPEELIKIAKRSASILKIKIDNQAAEIIAHRSRGTPRVLNRLLRRIRDFAEVANMDVITKEIAEDSLNRLDVDSNGLNSLDRKILKTIIENYNGGPVGLNTIAASIGEDKGTIEEVFEPFLIMEGFLERTARGRKCTNRAYKHLGYKDNRELTLF